MSRVITEIHRRRFLVGAIALAGVAVALGPSAIRLIRDFAQQNDAIDPGLRADMVRMARLLYPHDAIADQVYAEVLDDSLTSVAGDSGFADTLRAAEQTLDAGQSQTFLDLDEEAQIAVMQAVETREFFVAIQQAVRGRLYNHPAVWALLGYEGPSFERGGYLNQGAGVIDWLPEAQ